MTFQSLVQGVGLAPTFPAMSGTGVLGSGKAPFFRPPLQFIELLFFQDGLAKQVPALVAEVEGLREQVADASENERKEIILDLEIKLQGLAHPDMRRAVAAVIEGLRKRKS